MQGATQEAVKGTAALAITAALRRSGLPALFDLRKERELRADRQDLL
jgi:hypothetical protein